MILHVVYVVSTEVKAAPQCPLMCSPISLAQQSMLSNTAAKMGYDEALIKLSFYRRQLQASQEAFLPSYQAGTDLYSRAALPFSGEHEG